jgi:hypothetical protein
MLVLINLAAKPAVFVLKPGYPGLPVFIQSRRIIGSFKKLRQISDREISRESLHRIQIAPQPGFIQQVIDLHHITPYFYEAVVGGSQVRSIGTLLPKLAISAVRLAVALTIFCSCCSSSTRSPAPCHKYSQYALLKKEEATA